MLTAHDLTVEVAGRTIVEGLRLEVRAGDKIGLVGRNGAGKTTLFRVLGGGADPRSGRVERSEATGYLSQEARSDNVPDDTPCMAHVLSGRGLDEAAAELEKLTVALEEDASMEAIERFSAAQERFERLGGYAAEAEIHRLTGGLGLRPDRLGLHLGALSGGERRRLDLARILFAGSHLLLLDEPTNHLDADARDWLLRFLRDFRGALIVVSHDLDLLDAAITRVLHLDRDGDDAVGQVVEYRGTYTQYQTARRARESRLSKQVERQDKEITRLRQRADSMRGQTAKRARVAKNLDARAERIRHERVEGPSHRKRIAVHLPDPPSSGRTALDVTGLARRFGDVAVFDGVEFSASRGERLLVMGLNGAGKTTLLKVLAGRLVADAGEVATGHQVRIGYFAQEHDGIVDGRSLLDHMIDSSPAPRTTLRGVLGMFGLTGGKVFQDAATLSGGEKTKLALAQLVAGGHNVLLLDEPTNHLDPEARTAIGHALSGWAGTMIVVSHDVDFVRALQPDRVLIMPEGDLDHFSDETLELVELA